MSSLFLCGPLRRISVNARLYVQCCLVLLRVVCYGRPLQSPDEIQVQSLSVLKKVALLIGLACCVSRPGACGGLWTGQMLLVCSTNVSVMCMYCVLFDSRRKLKVTKSSERKLRRKNASFTTELSLLRTNKNKILNDELYKNKQRTLP